MSWEQCDLASLVSVLESGSRPKGGASTKSGEVPSLGGENILQSGGVTLNEVKRVPKKFYEKMGKGHLLDTDVLINKDGAQTGKVGLYTQQNSVPSCINEHLFLIRGNAQKITQEYLYYTLLSQTSQNQIDAQVSGSAQPGLKSDFLRGIFVEIPDTLYEQTKITEILSTVDQAIDQTQALIAKQQLIKTGLIQDLLTRGIDEDGNLRSEETHEFKDSPLGRIPVEWESECFQSCISGSPKNGIYKPLSAYGDQGTPIIRIDGFSHGDRIRAQSYKRVALSKSEIDQFRLRDGEILINRVNSIQYLGKTALVEYLPEVTVFESNMMRLTIDRQRMLPDFALLILTSSATSRHFLNNAKLAIAQVSINQQDVNSLWIQRPNLEEQCAICERIESIDDSITNTLSGLEKLHRVKIALMQDLLTGKVSVIPLITKEKIDV